MSRNEIEQAIKAQGGWDKSSYAYAIAAMDVYNAKGRYYTEYKKTELVDEFYRLCETRFDRIANSTTFR